MGNCIPNIIDIKNNIQQQCSTCISSLSEMVHERYAEELKAEISNTTKKIIPANIYQNCTYENTPTYSYENLRSLIKILRVVDGDTIDIALYYEETGKIFQHRVRLYGIDTPEKRPSLSNEDRDKEIAASKKSLEALTQKLKENDNIVIALFYKPDKYGRLLCTLYDKQGDDINKWMIQSGFAYEYFGKTKKKFSQVVTKTSTIPEYDTSYFEKKEQIESNCPESDDDFENITNISTN